MCEGVLSRSMSLTVYVLRSEYVPNCMYVCVLRSEYVPNCCVYNRPVWGG